MPILSMDELHEKRETSNVGDRKLMGDSGRLEAKKRHWTLKKHDKFGEKPISHKMMVNHPREKVKT